MSPVLITGGAQRLGLAMAEALLDQGTPVIVTYRTEKPSVRALAEKGAKVLQCDFADNAAITHLIHTVSQQYSSLRAIIHNASDWDQESDNPDYAGLLTKMMQVHVSAPYQINLGLQELLLNHETVADIIHMTDYVQVKGSKKHIAYAASKAALHNLTLSFSALLAPQVKVNSIAPALLMFNEHDSDTYKAKALKKSLLEICPGAGEAVKAMQFLFASDFVTGQTMHLDGGRHLK
ncbi:dihydromonapterin reductase [Opacimonas viscosa]|uniref:Dihydromonapterin reductase n=1 Tax=Opacimonas viscosa TaxID=2961944 RepID=A0AA41X284_9ALTE|nr:dihydromonapterin reductase [Opacimonas viscosa]MCP3428151.1 dihydromonapterin reductase [Opacimonas viscosa]